MAAYDNVQLPGAPNIAQAGNYAQMLMQGLQALPQEYWKGQDARYQQRNRDLFQNPDNKDLLINATGTDNYAQLLQKIVQAGGAQSAQGLMPLLLQRQGQSVVANALNGSGGSNSGPASSTGSAAGPSNLPPATSGTPRQPNLSASGTDNSGEDTARTVLAGVFGGTDVPPAIMQNIAKAAGAADLDAPLTPQGAAQVRQIAGAYMTRQQGGQQPPQQSIPDGATITPVSTSPAPPQQPAATFNQRFAAAYPQGGSAPAAAPSPGGAQVSQYDDQINQYEAKARRKFTAAAFPGLSKEQADTLRESAKADMDVAKQLRDQRNELVKPTDAMRNAQASGAGTPLDYERKKDINALKVKDFESLDKGIQAQDEAAYDNDEDMRAMHGILNDPKLFTGAGQQFVDSFRSLAINAGLMNPNDRLPNDALKKVTSKALQAQMNQMRDDAAEIGGSAGRTMLAQIKIMQDAAQNPEMSKPGLRYLTELGDRANRRTHDIAQLARDYKKAHGGVLDDGFYQVRAAYAADPRHSLMTDQEMEHHQLIASPHLPAGVERQGKDAIAQWARSQGLRPGDPIRLGDTYPAVYKPSP